MRSFSLSVGQVDVADEDVARGEAVEAGHAVHQRRLAGAGRAHDGGEAPGVDVEVTPSRAFTSVSPLAVDLHGVHGPGGDGAGGGGGGGRFGDGHRGDLRTAAVG